MLSDNLLLTSLWLVPLIGVVVVLALPKRSEQAAKWVSLGFTSLTFLITLVMLGVYLESDSTDAGPAAPLATRAENNKLDRGRWPVHRRRPRSKKVICWSGGAWIPYFNIQYYLGVDGISLSLVVLTGLVSVLACLASWNIDKQVKGYFALYLLLDRQHARRLHLARPVLVLRLLRSDALADVLPDRHLGRAAGASMPPSSSCFTRSSARCSSWSRS